MSTEPVFAPVPLRARRDGWTPARQIAFVAALVDTRCVAAACRAMGMSWQSAYRLRARADAASFAAAWDAALAPPALRAGFSGRALGGVARPIMYRGRKIGERRRYDNRLAMFLLRLRAPGHYGAAVDPVEPADWRDDADALIACGQGDFSGDVARSSSPSAGASAPRPSPRRNASAPSILRRDSDPKPVQLRPEQDLA